MLQISNDFCQAGRIGQFEPRVSRARARLVALTRDAILTCAVTLLAASGARAAAWLESDIRASRVVRATPANASGGQLGAARGVASGNLFAAVETGDNYITLLDGDRFNVLHRLPTRAALRGEPAFSADGRSLYFATGDGWIVKFDLGNLQVSAEIRVGIETRDLAMSRNGKFLAVANSQPNTLVLLDADLNLQKVLPVRNRENTASSSIAVLRDAASRQSFVAVLQDLPEAWEISYDPAAEDLPAGMIHDFQYKEGAFIPGFLNPRRTILAEPLDQFILVNDANEMFAAGRISGAGQVIHLDVRKKIAELDVPARSGFGGVAAFQWQGRRVLALPGREDGITIIDLAGGRRLQSLPLAGPGRAVHTHERTPYLWADSALSTARDTLTVFDKRTLEKFAEIRPDPGKTVANVAFTRDGRFAIACLVERKSEGGALIVIDALTLREIRRIPADRPAGIVLAPVPAGTPAVRPR